jgi:hypothetical protein
MRMGSCSVPLFDWTRDKSINPSYSKDRAHPAPEQCFCAAADPSYPSATFNLPLRAMSKPQSSNSSNVQDLELDSTTAAEGKPMVDYNINLSDRFRVTPFTRFRYRTNFLAFLVLGLITITRESLLLQSERWLLSVRG